MGLIFFQGIICPSSSPELINASSKSASSPFTIGFTEAGWKSSGHFVNALIIVAFISAGNGCIYVQSRALYSLALTNRAPKFFTITSKKGSECFDISISSIVTLLTPLSSLCRHPNIVLLGLSCIDELENYRWTGLCVYHFCRRLGRVLSLGGHYFHPFACP
jgi:amino acid transporter